MFLDVKMFMCSFSSDLQQSHHSAGSITKIILMEGLWFYCDKMWKGIVSYVEMLCIFQKKNNIKTSEILRKTSVILQVSQKKPDFQFIALNNQFVGAKI